MAERITEAVRRVAFWTAALLPIAYLPLVAVEHAIVANPWALGKLVALNLAALVVGHSYSAIDRDDDS